jgi:hypothetical protein
LPYKASGYGQIGFEYVESYRGKPQYVKVQGKRRRKFQPFLRYRWHGGEDVYAEVCATNPCGGGDPYDYVGKITNFPFYTVRQRLNVADPEADKGTLWKGDPIPLFPYHMAELGNYYREFIIRDMYSKLNSPRFNVAVFLAELDETIVGIHGLFKNCLGSLLRTSTASKNLKHLILNPEELWLWWRYMLMPTMMDVEDLIKATKDRLPVDRIQDGDQIEPTIESGVFTVLGYGHGCVEIDIPFDAEIKCGCGGAIDVLMMHDPSPWGTSSWDIIMASWERIPFSFIFDWFINVGDWLASLRDIETAIAQSYATYALDTKITVYDASPYVLQGKPEYTGFRMERITDVEPPSLPLVDKKWRNTLRTIDLISLSIGMLKSVLSRRK